MPWQILDERRGCGGTVRLLTPKKDGGLPDDAQRNQDSQQTSHAVNLLPPTWGRHLARGKSAAVQSPYGPGGGDVEVGELRGNGGPLLPRIRLGLG